MLIGLVDDTTNHAEFLADGNRIELLIDTGNTAATNFVTLEARVDPRNDSLDFVIPGSNPAVGLVD